MTHELVSVSECLLAIFTRVSLVVALVYAKMLRQMLTLGKGLRTYVTDVRSGYGITTAAL